MSDPVHTTVIRSDSGLVADIVATLSQQLSWSHFKQILPLKDDLAREFYAEMCRVENWSVRTLREKIDSDDFYLDLLFYHRRLQRLIAIDLKLGDFKAEYKGQMELYLRWLAKHEQQPDEEPPLGIILCAGKKKEQIELLELGASGIHVAEYLTELPSRELLQKKLQDAVESSRRSLGERGDS